MNSGERNMPSLESPIVSTARGIAGMGQPIGNGKCWALVHRVLHNARAKSAWDYDFNGENIFTPWGVEVEGPSPGYLIILKNVNWTTSRTETRGRGTVRSQVQVEETHHYSKHVAVILETWPNGDVLVAEQGAGKDSKNPRTFFIPLSRIKPSRDIRYYRPEPVAKGQETRSPTAAAKAAIK